MSGVSQPIRRASSSKVAGVPALRCPAKKNRREKASRNDDASLVRGALSSSKANKIQYPQWVNWLSRLVVVSFRLRGKSSLTSIALLSAFHRQLADET